MGETILLVAIAAALIAFWFWRAQRSVRKIVAGLRGSDAHARLWAMATLVIAVIAMAVHAFLRLGPNH